MKKPATPAIVYCDKCKEPLLPKDEKETIGKKVVCVPCYEEWYKDQQGVKQ